MASDNDTDIDRPAAEHEVEKFGPMGGQKTRRATEMAITARDVIGPVLEDREIKECMETALRLLNSMHDRPDLHSRSCLERFNDIVMGEIAEQSVIKWIKSQGKFAQSAVDKSSGRPDGGHDIILRADDGRVVQCSVKSSLSVYKKEMDEIIREFRLSSKKGEIRDINIQAYFWLDLKGRPRVSTPSDRNMALIGWCGRRDLDGREEGNYATEARPVVGISLSELRSMKSLIDILQ